MDTNPNSSSNRPNFLFILADDLGFSDIGCYGSEIQTPNIDLLASEGIRLLNHHTAAACSPTRAMLLTGTDAHLAGMGVMIEYKQNPGGQKRWSGKAGYEGYLNNDAATLPEILGDNGYCTLMSGKWHLGLRESQGPWARGFDRAFAMLPGACNHYGWEPRQEEFPIGGKPLHVENGTRVPIVPNKTEDPDGFYSTDEYTDRLIGYLDERSEEEKRKPFFAYLPYTAPHWPLQCEKVLREKYKGVYDEGPYVLRERRLRRLVELGIVDEGVIPHKVETTTMNSGEWDEFTEHEKKLSSRTMETYAGMVDSMDFNVGKVIDYLRKTGEYDNTFIVFMSDNGAEGSALEAAPILGDNIKRVIHQHYDNSLENIGNWNSFTWLGPLWAQASTAPSRLFKCWPSEGGILVPCIIKPPANRFSDTFLPGSFNRSFSTVMDFVPTFLDLAGVELPPATDHQVPTPLLNGTTTRKMTLFRDRPVHALRGRSWIPYFIHNTQASEAANNNVEDETWAIYPSTSPIGWELFARGALRKGDWKITHFQNLSGGAGVGDEGWQLFNIREDPGETTDLAAQEPEKLRELMQCWEEYVLECGVVWGETAMADGVGKEERPELWEDEMEVQRSWMGAGEVTRTKAVL